MMASQFSHGHCRLKVSMVNSKMSGSITPQMYMCLTAIHIDIGGVADVDL